jgi:hypothetical protein
MKTVGHNSLEYWTPKLRAALGRQTKSIVEIGDILRKCREVAEHGTFLLWLHDNFDLGQASAYNYIHASEYAELKAEVTTVVNLSPTVLYKLAEGRFSSEEEREIQKASRTDRVDMERAEAICKELAEAEKAKAEAEAQSQDNPEIDENLANEASKLDGEAPTSKKSKANPHTIQVRDAVLALLKPFGKDRSLIAIAFEELHQLLETMQQEILEGG